MQSLRGASNASKTRYRKSMIKGVNLPCTVDEDSSHSKFLIVLLVTLPSIYRKNAIITIHKQSPKRSKRTKKILRKTSKPSNKTHGHKLIFNSRKIFDFDLNRRYISRASIWKKNQLNQSYETQVMIKEV